MSDAGPTLCIKFPDLDPPEVLTRSDQLGMKAAMKNEGEGEEVGLARKGKRGRSKACAKGKAKAKAKAKASAKAKTSLKASASPKGPKAKAKRRKQRLWSRSLFPAKVRRARVGAGVVARLGVQRLCLLSCLKSLP